jgi:hypothetical protein
MGNLVVFYMPQSCDVGLMALLPLLRKACLGFFRSKNLKASAGFEPANLSTGGQHANHQTTEAAHKIGKTFHTYAKALKYLVYSFLSTQPK